MTANLIGINFSHIRPLNGHRHEGFEELAVSLFRAEFGELVRRIDGAGGDGGVEAYVRREDGSVVGLQAKYFTERFGRNQFNQIKDSIRTAVRNYPDLREYIVVCPQDFTPSGDPRWTVIEEGFEASNPDLQLRYWGPSKLIELLTDVRHSARIAYWFNTPRYDHEWLKSHSLSSIDALDIRYTPDSHVDVEAGEIIAAFAHNRDFVRTYYDHARTFWNAWKKGFGNLHASDYTVKRFTDFNEAVSHALATGENRLSTLGNNQTLPVWSELTATIEALFEVLREMERRLDGLVEPRDNRYDTGNKSGQRAFEKVRELEGSLYEFADFVEKFKCAGSGRLLITGDVGSGKSHTLARSTEQLLSDGHHVLLMLGEAFSTAGDPWQQLKGMLDWPGTVEELLAALEHSAEVSGKRSLIIIDALNESSDRRTWQNHLKRFASRLNHFPNVGLAVSCRSDFCDLTLPRDLTERRDQAWSFWEHVGYGGSTYAAIVEYFKNYDIRVRDFPPLYPEFSNPLFLKTFCEAFSGGEIPAGALSFDQLMRRRIQTACKQVADAIDCPEDIVEEAIVSFSKMASIQGGFRVPRNEVRAMTVGLQGHAGESRSLYKHLISCGMLSEVPVWTEGEDSTMHLRFSYERFSDYFAAIQLLKEWEDNPTVQVVEQVRAVFPNEQAYFENRGLARMLAILIPERFGVEFLSISIADAPRSMLLGDFLDSLLWRRPENFTEVSQILFEEAGGFEFRDKASEVRISLACVPGHPLNANSWHEELKALTIAERDETWTFEVSEGLGQWNESRADLFIRWVQDSSAHPLSLEQLRLAGLLLSWFFTSNDRGFRRRAIIAASKLLCGKISVLIQLIKAQADCNDPYVVEGVFAVAAAVAVRVENDPDLHSLAECVHRTLFSKDEVYPHILIRDYGFITLTVAAARQALPEGIERSSFEPPYRSSWPSIPTDEELAEIDDNDDWRIITSSIEPEYRGERIGCYGDFGRYVMGAHVHHWLNVRLSDPYPDERARGQTFSGTLARRYILNRVSELGWTPSRFLAYDQSLHRGRLSVSDENWKVERISKKYQWIALSELEAYLSDHYHFAEHFSAPQSLYQGAWQLFSRNFDVTAPLVDPTVPRHYKEVDKSEHWWVNYPKPFEDEHLVRDRSAWARQHPQNIDGMLCLESEDPNYPGNWLLLYGATSWDEPDVFPPRGVELGDLRMFIHTRAWLVEKSALKATLEALNQRNFFGSGISVPGLARMSLYDYPHGRAHEDVREHWRTEDHFGDHTTPFPSGLIHTTSQYDEGHIKLPSPRVVNLLGLSWKPDSYEFVDSSGETIAFQYEKHSFGGNAPCLVRMDKLQEVMEREGLALVWGSTGERDCSSRDPVGRSKPADSALNFSMLHWLDDDGTVRGGLSMTDLIEFTDPAVNGGSYPRREEYHPIEMPDDMPLTTD